MPKYRNRASGLVVETEVPDARLELSWDRIDEEEERARSWPSTHKALDAFAEEHGFEFPEGSQRVAHKIEALEYAGFEAPEEE